MRVAVRTLLATLLCLALPGCFVKMHGVQSTSGGTTTTAASSQVRGSASFAGGKASFSSGRVPPPGAPGGHVYLGKGASLLLITGIVVADFFNYLRGEPVPKALSADTKIMDTCSCYKKEVISDE
jgi:hypothetical protein